MCMLPLTLYTYYESFPFNNIPNTKIDIMLNIMFYQTLSIKFSSSRNASAFSTFNGNVYNANSKFPQAIDAIIEENIIAILFA